MNPATNHNNSNPSQEVLFSGIFREHEQPLFQLATRLTKSEQIAKDIIQDVFLKLWEHRDSLDEIVNMRAWLYRLTENRIIDFLRKAAADNRLKKNMWQQIRQINNEAELFVAAKEYSQIMQKAISSLPPQRKLIYQLNKEEGMNYQEIANELHISRHTVKNQLFTAMQSVRDFISRNTKLFSIFF